jgi:nicotinate-nucleotide--dimethylbenzimidazole phosphoribosyltransferase
MRNHQLALTKPAGSLGRLEELAVWFSGCYGQFPPPENPAAAILVFAADHGIVAEGVSAYPSSVTEAMVRNMAAGGAAINSLASAAGARLYITDVGVAASLDNLAVSADVVFRIRKVRMGTGNFAKGPAMSEEEAWAAIGVGRDLAREAIANGAQVIAVGEMGIGNTTPASAITSVYTGLEPCETAGRGTGVSDSVYRHKMMLLQRVLREKQPDGGEPIKVLVAVGGLEFAAMAGAMIEAALHRVPTVLDGFLANAAALVARALAPGLVDWLLAGHLSQEPGARHAIRALGLRPLLDLDLRLGEGSGAALALQILRTALQVQAKMATFQSAQVDGPVKSS